MKYFWLGFSTSFTLATLTLEAVDAYYWACSEIAYKASQAGIPAEVIDTASTFELLAMIWR